jgi:hypothetical protein
MTEDTIGPGAAWRRPATLAELRADLTAFDAWSPVVRARRAPELIEAARTVLADERAAAMRAAKAGGMGVTALARALGITRQKVYDALARVTAPAAGDPDTAAAGAGAYRLLYDGADGAWLLLSGDTVIADHDGLADDPAGAEAACSWATGVLVDEGAGPIRWQPDGTAQYTGRPAEHQEA